MPKTKKQSAEKRRKLQKNARKIKAASEFNLNNPIKNELGSEKQIDNIVQVNNEKTDAANKEEIKEKPIQNKRKNEDDEDNENALPGNSSKKRMQKVQKTNQNHKKKENMQNIRTNNRKYRTTETKKNRERMQKKRLNDEKYSSKEKEQNKERIREKRLNDETYRSKEKVQNKDRMQDKRLNDTQYKSVENELNKKRIQDKRLNDVNYREQELKKNMVRKQNIKKENELFDDEFPPTALTNNKTKFQTLIEEGPTQVCDCCDRLWFPRQTNKIIREKVIQKHNEELWKAIFKEEESGIVCASCHDNIFKIGKLPKYCKTNMDIIFEIPEVLQNLTTAEERLICPRLPYMQIRRRGINQQSSIKGQIVNVPISMDTMVKALPRNVDDTHTIQLKLKKRIQHNTDYLCETIRPKRVIEAAEYLIQQPLYKQLGINLSNNWNDNHNSDFRFDEANEVDKDNVDDLLEAEMKEILDEFEREDLMQMNLNPGGEETLLDNENYENLVLAPGENKRPIHLMLDEQAEELSFPTIFCGKKKEFYVKLSYNDVARIQAAHRDRRFARTDFLLYMYKKEMLIQVVDIRKEEKSGKIT